MTDPCLTTQAVRLAFSVPAEVASIAQIRHIIVALARTLPFTEEDLEDIELAVSEAFTNIVQHAPGFRVRGITEVRPDQLAVRLEVEPSLEPYLERRHFPTGLSGGGRGIPLLHLLFPIVEVRQRDDNIYELRLVKPVRGVAGLPPERSGG